LSLPITPVTGASQWVSGTTIAEFTIAAPRSTRRVQVCPVPQQPGSQQQRRRPDLQGRQRKGRHQDHVPSRLNIARAIGSREMEWMPPHMP
jgi:hypothetical protein